MVVLIHILQNTQRVGGCGVIECMVDAPNGCCCELLQALYDCYPSITDSDADGKDVEPIYDESLITVFNFSFELLGDER